MDTRTAHRRRRPHAIERVRRRLLAQAPLFEEEQAYVAGVEDALEAVLDLDDVEIRLDEEPPGPGSGTGAAADELPPDGAWFG